MSAGYWLSRGAVDGTTMVAAAVAAVVAGDLFLYLAGRTGLQLGVARGRRATAGLAKLERAFARYGATLLLAGRFVPGVRSALLVAAGAGRVPLGRLLACDGAAALVGAGAWIAIGWRLGPQLERARAIFVETRSWLVALAVIAAGIAVLWMYRMRAASRRQMEESVGPAARRQDGVSAAAPPRDVSPRRAPRRDRPQPASGN